MNMFASQFSSLEILDLIDSEDKDEASFEFSLVIKSLVMSFVNVDAMMQILTKIWGFKCS